MLNEKNLKKVKRIKVLSAMIIIVTMNFFGYISNVLAAPTANTFESKVSASINSEHQVQETFIPNEIIKAVKNITYYYEENLGDSIINQIKIYINRDPEIFLIDTDVIEVANPRMLLLILKRVNHIFENYKTFTKKFINLKHIYEDKFKIRLADKDLSRLMSMGFADLNISEKFISNSIEKQKKECEFGIRDGWNPLVEKSMLISSYVAHEMGHLVQLTKLMNLLNLSMQKLQNGIVVTEDITYENVAKKMKSDILKIAREKYSNKNEEISEYGKTNAKEWFAEAFAHYECSKEENLNPIGKAVRDYMVKWR